MKLCTLAFLAGSIGMAAAASGTPLLEDRASTTTTPITVSGNAFYQGNNRFYIRGVAYAPGGGIGTVSDPIANATTCKRDIVYFKQLGINTIRVYAIDNTADHDECMNALAEAGIYLVLDTDTPKYSINRADPVTSYNSVYLQSVFATIDMFAKYPNTLAFLSGNEVINDAANTNCAPYVKAVTRDMKNYIRSRKYRAIPVGYSAADVAENQQLMAQYMNCGTDDQRSDFYAINDYSWCDPSSYSQSGWDQLVKNYAGYGIPIFMSEYGCITNTRTFQEVAALYSDEMTAVFSGGLVYEYSNEGNGYGLVDITPSSSVVITEQFTYLATAFANTTNPTGDGDASASNASSACPPQSDKWVLTSDALPVIPSAAAKFMATGAGTGPGLSGDGSQDAGTPETESGDTSSSSSSSSSSSGTATSTVSPSSTKKSEGVLQTTPINFMNLSPIGIVFVAMLGGMAAGVM